MARLLIITCLVLLTLPVLVMNCMSNHTIDFKSCMITFSAAAIILKQYVIIEHAITGQVIARC